eukprot:647671-Alexandrium_andersonii.AAC.1
MNSGQVEGGGEAERRPQGGSRPGGSAGRRDIAGRNGCPAGAGGGASAVCRNGGRRCAWGGLEGGAARAAPAVREEGWCC